MLRKNFVQVDTKHKFCLGGDVGNKNCKTKLSLIQNCIHQIDKKLHTHNNLLFSFDDLLIKTQHKISFYWSFIFDGEFKTLTKWLSYRSKNSLNPETYNKNREIIINMIKFYFPEKNQDLITAKYDTIQNYVVKKHQTYPPGEENNYCNY